VTAIPHQSLETISLQLSPRLLSAEAWVVSTYDLQKLSETYVSPSTRRTALFHIEKPSIEKPSPVLRHVPKSPDGGRAEISHGVLLRAVESYQLTRIFHFSWLGTRLLPRSGVFILWTWGSLSATASVGLTKHIHDDDGCFVFACLRSRGLLPSMKVNPKPDWSSILIRPASKFTQK
jgi:hypothetical protein